MTTFYDVPAKALIEAVAEHLETEEAIEEPDWMAYVKSGSDRELPPEQEDFWVRRSASVLRKVAIDGPVGVGALKREYGSAAPGSTRYRVRPRKKAEGSGNIIRTALQQLEEAGYVETAEGEGRKVTPEGHQLLNDIAAEVMETIDEPDLARYA